MPKQPTQRANLLTVAQQQKVTELVRLHHYALVIELMGDKAVPPHIVNQVRTAGLYRKPRISPTGSLLRRAFVHGKVSLLEPTVLQMNNKQFEDYVAKKSVDLTRDEVEAYDLVRRSLIAHMETLADDLNSNLSKALLKADKRLQRKLAKRQRDSLLLELERRKALASIAKDMQSLTVSQVSKANRTITTETNNAFQDGRAQEIIAKSGQEDPRVFKRPRHDACAECNKAYLEDDGVTPKVFALSTLIENGSNIGKSRHEREPVIESFHPWCNCELHWLPPGFGFNKQGSMVYVGRASA